jgi:hypothetical protein
LQQQPILDLLGVWNNALLLVDQSEHCRHSAALCVVASTISISSICCKFEIVDGSFQINRNAITIAQQNP